MTNYTELKRLAKAAGSVEWKWWESNSTLRLTTEVNGRHGADGDAISAYRDSVHCHEPFRAFIESASPASILALIAEIQRLDENPGMRAIRSLRADCKDLMAERDQLKAELAGLRTGFDAQNEVIAGLKAERELFRLAGESLSEDVKRLRAENEALRTERDARHPFRLEPGDHQIGYADGCLVCGQWGGHGGLPCPRIAAISQQGVSHG